MIFESFQAGYLKPLDYDLCMGLSNSTAKRMYRFLDKRFHHKPDWTFDLKELAHEHIGLAAITKARPTSNATCSQPSRNWKRSAFWSRCPIANASRRTAKTGKSA